MEDKDNSERFSSAWNLSQFLIQQISFLLNSASLNFRRGSPQRSFYDTEEISTLISAYLNEKEEQELNNLGKKICRLYSYYRRLGGEDDEDIKNLKLYNRVRTLHNNYIKLYRKRVNFLLNKYNLGLAKREDSSRMF